MDVTRRGITVSSSSSLAPLSSQRTLSFLQRGRGLGQAVAVHWRLEVPGGRDTATEGGQVREDWEHTLGARRRRCRRRQSQLQGFPQSCRLARLCTGRKWGAREERLLPCRARERRAGQPESTELPKTVRRLWERSRERRAGREENCEDSSRDSRLWLGTGVEEGEGGTVSPHVDVLQNLHEVEAVFLNVPQLAVHHLDLLKVGEMVVVELPLGDAGHPTTMGEG